MEALRPLVLLLGLLGLSFGSPLLEAADAGKSGASVSDSRRELTKKDCNTWKPPPDPTPDWQTCKPCFKKKKSGRHLAEGEEWEEEEGSAGMMAVAELDKIIKQYEQRRKGGASTVDEASAPPIHEAGAGNRAANATSGLATAASSSRRQLWWNYHPPPPKRTCCSLKSLANQAVVSLVKQGYTKTAYYLVKSQALAKLTQRGSFLAAPNKAYTAAILSAFDKHKTLANDTMKYMTLEVYNTFYQFRTQAPKSYSTLLTDRQVRGKFFTYNVQKSSNYGKTVTTTKKTFYGFESLPQQVTALVNRPDIFRNSLVIIQGVTSVLLPRGAVAPKPPPPRPPPPKKASPPPPKKASPPPPSGTKSPPPPPNISPSPLVPAPGPEAILPAPPTSPSPPASDLPTASFPGGVPAPTAASTAVVQDRVFTAQAVFAPPPVLQDAVVP